jgi:hypothetical protein
MSGGGRRKDGKPFKDGNGLPDGSYKVGKGRTPEATRFATGDGRKRGKRPKGSRNFEKDWEEELSKPVRVVRNGKTIKVSAHHAQVMKTLELASKGKERSQELVFRKAERLGDRAPQASSRADDELIASWLAELSSPSEGPIIVSDDDDLSDANEAANFDDERKSDDQQ